LTICYNPSLNTRMDKERASKGERKHIRILKQQDEVLSKKNWRGLLQDHLQKEIEGFVGLSALGEEGLQAVTEWYTIRSRFRAREIGEEQFKQLRSDFVERYDEVTKNGIVNVAIKFITQKTEVTGLIRTTLRD